MSEKMVVYVACAPNGAPMRAFEDEGAAKAYKFALKASQPAAGFSIKEVDLYGPLAALEGAAGNNPNYFKVHAVLDKKKNPHSIFVGYKQAKATASATKFATRAPLILDRSKYDE